jgi:hypothetical protein
MESMIKNHLIMYHLIDVDHLMFKASSSPMAPSAVLFPRLLS